MTAAAASVQLIIFERTGRECRLGKVIFWWPLFVRVVVLYYRCVFSKLAKLTIIFISYILYTASVVSFTFLLLEKAVLFFGYPIFPVLLYDIWLCVFLKFRELFILYYSRVHFLVNFEELSQQIVKICRRGNTKLWFWKSVALSIHNIIWYYDIYIYWFFELRKHITLLTLAKYT